MWAEGIVSSKAVRQKNEPREPLGMEVVEVTANSPAREAADSSTLTVQQEKVCSNFT